MNNRRILQPNHLKDAVREKYGQIVRRAESDKKYCCEDQFDETAFHLNYHNLEGYYPDADLGLGCGIPTRYAGLQEGQHLLDLGSGAGNDCFVARRLIGESGTITGLDFTPEMIAKANKNLQKTDFKNINFVLGEIEKMPFPDNTFDVVISNCVLNLVPDKRKAFAEIHRVLKKSGHFCISDIVLKGSLHKKLLLDAELWVGCLSGALQKDYYLEIIKETGFSMISVVSETSKQLPESLLKKYLKSSEIIKMQNNQDGILSITVKASKL